MLKPSDIGKVRKRLGITQARLAKISNVSQSLIAKIESGRIDPSFSRALLLSETLEGLQRQNSLKAIDIMTKNVVYVISTSTIENAAKVMNMNAISQMPVYDQHRTVGSFSEKTILKILSVGGDISSMFKQQIKMVMDEPFPTVAENAPVDILYSILNFAQAIIVIKKGKMIGIVTKADLLKVEQLV